MTSLEIESNHLQPDLVVLSIVGELDISTVSVLEKELRRLQDGDAGALVVDLSALRFLDSSGLRVIVAAGERAHDAGKPLALLRGPEAVQRVFRVTMLEERLCFIDDLAEFVGKYRSGRERTQ